MGTQFEPVNIASGFNTNASLNANFTAIQTALSRLLNVYGDTTHGDNVMRVDLDMGSKQLVNLTTPTAPTHAVTKAYGDANYGGAAVILAEAAQAAAEAAQAAAELAQTGAEAAEVAAAASAAAAAISAAAALVSEGNAAGWETLAQEWATLTTGLVDATDYSAKEYAQGSQASTGGSAKNWAQQTGGQVTGAGANDRSAKAWAQSVLTGATLQGSAKDWAQTAEDSPVDGGAGYSAKHWAAKSFGAVADTRVTSDIAAFQSMEATLLSKTNTLDGFLDKFVDQNFVDTVASLNEVYVAGHYYENLRPFKNTIDEEPFDDLLSWVDGDIGTGTTTIVATGSSDPAIGANAARLDTGASAGSGHRAIQHQDYGAGVIPSTFGLSTIINQQTPGSGGGNHFQIQADNGTHIFAFRFHSGNIYYLDSTASEVFLFTHGTAGEWSEYWFECESATKRIRLFAGTVLLADVTAATLLASTNSGRVMLRQHGDTETNRVTDVGILQVGSSALPGQMTLISNKYVCDYVPTRAEVVILLDDVSAYTVLNTTFIAYLSVDDGATWQELTLTQRSVYGDSLSNHGGSFIRILTSRVTIAAPTDKNCRLKVVAGGVPARQVSVYGWALHLLP